MRPLQPLRVPDSEGVGQHSTALLMNAFGPYCSISERPVPDVVHAWSVSRHEEVGVVGSGGAYDDLLLLDPASRTALRASSRTDLSGLRLPGRDLTFTLPDPPLFRYALEPVAVTYLDDDGEADGAPVEEQLAIVRSDDEAARRTIDAFALNTQYFDAALGNLRIPRRHYLAMMDHRLHHRTTAWRRAERLAELIDAAAPEARNLLLDQARHVAAATGFWSVWATVLWTRFQDVELARRALVEPREQVERLLEARRDAGLPALAHHIGSGPHNAFPGTRLEAFGA